LSVATAVPRATTVMLPLNSPFCWCEGASGERNLLPAKPHRIQLARVFYDEPGEVYRLTVRGGAKEWTIERRASEVLAAQSSLIDEGLAGEALGLRQWFASLSPLALSRVMELLDAESTGEPYSPHRVIGKGSFGQVLLVSQGEEWLAMKVLDKSQVLKKRQAVHARTERLVLELLKGNPFVVDMRAAFQDDRNLYLVLEFCSGGDLFFYLTRRKLVSEDAVLFYAAEVVSALDAVHRLSVVYRDLKPENLLLTARGHLKLTDFGLAKMDVGRLSGAFSLCGTPEYMAPEILARRGHGMAVDLWSFGMLLHELLAGLPPWYTTDRDLLSKRILYAPLKLSSTLSIDAAVLVESCLERDPASRPTTREILDTAEYFATIDFDMLPHLDPPLQPDHNDDPTGNFDDVKPVVSLEEFSAPPPLRVPVVLEDDADFADYDFRETSCVIPVLCDSPRYDDDDDDDKLACVTPTAACGGAGLASLP